MGILGSKGIAVHTIVLVIIMGFFAFVGIFLFYKWSDTTDVQANVASCTFKRIAYCTDWAANEYRDEPWGWNDKNPIGCNEYGISKPTEEDCQLL